MFTITRPRWAIAACDCAPYASWVFSVELKLVLPSLFCFCFVFVPPISFPHGQLFFSTESQFQCRGNLHFRRHFPCLPVSVPVALSPVSVPLALSPGSVPNSQSGTVPSVSPSPQEPQWHCHSRQKTQWHCHPCQSPTAKLSVPEPNSGVVSVCWCSSVNMQ